jgi:hypothetical protein
MQIYRLLYVFPNSFFFFLVNTDKNISSRLAGCACRPFIFAAGKKSRIRPLPLLSSKTYVLLCVQLKYTPVLLLQLSRKNYFCK